MSRNRTHRAATFASAILLINSVPLVAGFNIVPIFDGTVTNAPNAADYIAGFNYATQQFTSHFTNDVSVNIKVTIGGTGGSSISTFTSGYTYQELRTALASHSTIAAAGLPADDPITATHAYSLTVANAAATAMMPIFSES